MNKSFFHKHFRLICCFIVLCFSGCTGKFYVYDKIGEIAWDQDAILFDYTYVKETSQSNGPSELGRLYVANTYRVPLNRSPNQVLKTMNVTSSQELLPFFETASSSYVREHLEEFKPTVQEQTVKKIPNGPFIWSYQPEKKVMLLGSDDNKVTYTLINTEDNTFKNVEFSTQIPGINSSTRISIRWIGLNNQVLVEYWKDNQMFHGIATIDLTEAKLFDLKIFKQYQASKHHLTYGDYIISKMFDDTDVKVLGWESPEVVYYLEKPANSNEVKLVKQSISNGQIEQLATLDQEKSYYKYLDQSSQVSMKQKKVAYNLVESSSEQNIYVADLDGKNPKLLVSRKKDLPNGQPVWLN